MKIGENIKALRKSKNMTQEELAAKIHTTRQAISNYEKGRSDPDLETISRIAEALETDPSVILYGDDHSQLHRTLKIMYQTIVPFVLVTATAYLVPIIVADTFVRNDPFYWGVVSSIGIGASCVVHAIIRKDSR